MMDRWKQISSNSVLRNVLALSCLCALGIAVYTHTLSAPWYLDDIPAIVDNRDIQQLSTALKNTFSGSRGIADLTFAINYHFSETRVAGYHLVNIGIHLLTGWLAFLILKRVFRSSTLLPLAGALVFIVHPLQTQAVTYIVQRMTSLAALFFFLAVFAYIRFRESDHPQRWIFYSLALAAGAFAVLTKQNTAVLPVVVLLVDQFFLTEKKTLPVRKKLLLALPFAVAPFFVAVQYLLLPLLSDASLTSLGGMPDLVHLRGNNPLHYLVTQFSVIFIYLKLAFIPYGQALEYDFPIVRQLLTWQNMVALAGVISLAATAVYLRRRHPLISFGICWFFLTLVVESSIIPLDPLFEHRMYLPMFGIIILVLGLFQHLPQRSQLIGLTLVILTLSVLTWQRNNLWNDPVAFYEDNLRRAPTNERVHLDLANLYLRDNRVDEARRLYENALIINPDYVLIHINLARAYAAQGEIQKGIDILVEGIRRNPNHFRLYNNLAVLYNSVGKFEEAASYLRRGLALEPGNATVHFNLGIAYDRLGRFDEALDHFQRAISLSPTTPESHFNLGLVYFRRGDIRQALEAFNTAARIDPNHAATLYNMGIAYLELGDIRTARQLMLRLQQLNVIYAQRLHQRINATATPQKSE